MQSERDGQWCKGELIPLLTGSTFCLCVCHDNPTFLFKCDFQRSLEYIIGLDECKRTEASEDMLCVEEVSVLEEEEEEEEEH